MVNITHSRPSNLRHTQPPTRQYPRESCGITRYSLSLYHFAGIKYNTGRQEHESRVQIMGRRRDDVRDTFLDMVSAENETAVQSYETPLDVRATSGYSLVPGRYATTICRRSACGASIRRYMPINNFPSVLLVKHSWQKKTIVVVLLRKSEMMMCSKYSTRPTVFPLKADHLPHPPSPSCPNRAPVISSKKDVEPSR